MSKMPTDATSEIATRILSLRGQRVMLDSDLAAVYGVSTRRFNEQVRRNEVSFPVTLVLSLQIRRLKT